MRLFPLISGQALAVSEWWLKGEISGRAEKKNKNIFEIEKKKRKGAHNWGDLV